jgi:hypothetical protein
MAFNIPAIYEPPWALELPRRQLPNGNRPAPFSIFTYLKQKLYNTDYAHPTLWK